MPNPKRRSSKTRRDKRRTHYKANAPSVGTCPNCHEPKLRHRACPNCGYYNGLSIVVPKES
ncbi:MAG: 50S ribosomal protein L32 [Ignavibacteriales bacterium CG07_land_8_20_14_0_80_59_12]|jgi:large subunit ribosomal protein L32|nr:MAG: 50S ribosomal protein L32 [Ignavibacteriales bacterium CG07_land_8_20_14_0_80_59_12]